MIGPSLSLTRSFSTLQSRIIQCNKTIQELGKLGRIADARHLFDSMPQRDSVTWNTIISVYIQNGGLRDAQALFDSFQGKNLRTWTTLLAGYAKQGLLEDARAIFESMPERNVVSWNAMLSGYVQNGVLRKAREFFDQMPDRNVASWNSMMTGYCNCGLIREACELFDRMEEKNSVSWLVIISGYVELCEYGKAWDMFLMMLNSGLRPDQAILVSSLSAVTGLNVLKLLETLRTLVIKTGYEGDVVVGTAVLNAYTRVGSLVDAVKFFELLSVKNEYSWTTIIAAFSQCDRLEDSIIYYERAPVKTISVMTTMMAAYAQKGKISEAKNIFDRIKDPNILAWNAMLAGFSENGMLKEAKNLFERMPVRNIVSWAAMISGFIQNGQNGEALELFAELHRSGIAPNYSSLTSVLSACAKMGDITMGRQIHSLTIKMRCQYNSFVGNGLISMYAKCRNVEDLSQAFSTMKMRDTVSWNSAVSGFSENYMLNEARIIFERMPKQDVVSWTAIISAYAQAGEVDIALEFFRDMLRLGIKPKGSTFITILSSIGNFSIIKLGKQIHGMVIKQGYNSYVEVCNALVTMYFRCGNLAALTLFEEMPVHDLVSWNAVLSRCTRNGLSKEAIRIFEQMQAGGVLPDQISFQFSE